MKTIIGLTGNIASGKSAVAEILRNKGIWVVDADQVARQIVQKGSPVLQEIELAFGKSVLLPDGSLNRKVLADLVFSDESKLEQLNRITHPPIRKVLQDTIRRFKDQTQADLLVIEAPLLYETGLNQMVDQVWFVDSTENLRMERLMSRNGLTQTEALQRIGAQQQAESKIHRADVVISNNEDLDSLAGRVDEILQSLKNLTT